MVEMTQGRICHCVSERPRKTKYINKLFKNKLLSYQLIPWFTIKVFIDALAPPYLIGLTWLTPSALWRAWTFGGGPVLFGLALLALRPVPSVDGE
jgi:hypothetical protein